MTIDEAKEVLRKEAEHLHTTQPLVRAVITPQERGDLGIGIKVRFTVGPISFDTEAGPEQIVTLVKRIVQEFIAADIIPKSSTIS